jgi:3,4-dihydroxy 2-butanone 4-phosphate synthase / GTP cyclohydrolase II
MEMSVLENRGAGHDGRPLDLTPAAHRVAEAWLPTEHGRFRIVGFRSPATGEEVVALVMGSPRPDVPCLVRIHSQCLTGDVFGSVRCDCGRQLDAALRLVASAGEGVVVYQQQEGRGIGLVNKIRAYALQDGGLDTVEANVALGFAPDERSYGLCAAALRELGAERVRLISDNPEKIRALGGAGLEVVERVPLRIAPHRESARYLATKRDKMGHLVGL